MFRLVCLLSVVLSLATGERTSVAARQQCFDTPGITACLDEPFLGYWQANGNLPVFGYPIEGANVEHNADLDTDLLTQWLERNRLEVHPENAAPYNILLGRMGAERLRQLGRNPQGDAREGGAQAGCLWFETTGHNVCDQAASVGFKSYWQSHGLNIPGLDAYNRSVQLFGLPLTTPRSEKNAAGDTVLTQWFERARFEWHPDKPQAFKVLLGLLGNEIRDDGAALRRSPIFGAEVTQAGPPVVAKISEAQLHWVRHNGILWSSVEPTRGARNWAAIAGTEATIRAISAAGATPLIIVRGTPTWAQKVSGTPCGPIRADALDDFARFMGEVAARYKGAPYNVHHWEIGNEPDVASGLVDPNSPFGCWGDASDSYYGGGYYAEMLKRVYPVIKRADPRAQVTLGGLLLDCDPTYTYTPARNCTPAKFLEGVLRNGGGAAFDLLSYHGYPIYTGQIEDPELVYGTWKHRGGVVVGKVDFLRTVLRQYNVAKPIILTEGGLICYRVDANCPTSNMRDVQANYAVRMYTRAWANGLVGAIWFTLDESGYRESGLLEGGSQAARPAYTTLKFLSTLLNGASYVGPRRNGDAEGYAFRKGATTYLVYWTNGPATVNLAAPVGLRAVYNIAGQPTTQTGGTVRISFQPVVLEVRP